MANQSESNAELTPTSRKWVSDDDTISNYGHYGAISGAALGFSIVLSADLHCRFIKNSQGCGIDGIGSAVIIYGVMTILIGVIGLGAGREIGKLPPSLRRSTVVLVALFFLLQFTWPEILMWLQPELSGTFWDKKFRACALAILLIIYFGVNWNKLRKLKREP